MELRRSGFTLSEIADQLGYAGPSGARRAIETALQKALHHEAGALRALEGERLDRLQRALWGKAETGNVGAVEAILKVMERRAKLFGLDVPKQHVVFNEPALAEIARRVAVEQGLDPEGVLAEAEKILQEVRAR
ncbi:MAG: hypothetical protein KC442_07265 [Thermomicrobiales bacterium]|nr:hypothetical protein [Thermomicrobiales bacterium]